MTNLANKIEAQMSQHASNSGKPSFASELLQKIVPSHLSTATNSNKPPDQSPSGVLLGARPTVTAAYFTPVRTVHPKTFLTDQEIIAFARDGFIILRNALPQEQITAALAVSNAAYESGNYGWSDANPTNVVTKFQEDVCRHPAITVPLQGTILFAICIPCYLRLITQLLAPLLYVLHLHHRVQARSTPKYRTFQWRLETIPP